MKFKVHKKSIDQLNVVEEASSETYKLKKPMDIQISD